MSTDTQNYNKEIAELKKIIARKDIIIDILVKEIESHSKIVHTIKVYCKGLPRDPYP